MAVRATSRDESSRGDHCSTPPRGCDRRDGAHVGGRGHSTRVDVRVQRGEQTEESRAHTPRTTQKAKNIISNIVTDMDRIVRTGSIGDLPSSIVSYIWQLSMQAEKRAAQVITALVRRTGAIYRTVGTWNNLSLFVNDRALDLAEADEAWDKLLREERRLNDLRGVINNKLPGYVTRRYNNPLFM